jgi:diguanylate cyclase (GGDEF)-like protein
VADVINRNVRTSDIAGRLGGDEFAVLLPESNPETAENFFNKLHQKLCRIVVRHKPITFSVGVVTFLQAPAFAQEMINMVNDLMHNM